MDYQAEQNTATESGATAFDYSYVSAVARVAVYDDLRMAPRVIEVQPAPTAEYIEKLADVIDEQKRRLGGRIPYSAIREVSENFIHARFTEVVVSILDGGNTIRFCDQGPGIRDSEKAVLPGFTSAVEPMKRYIRGVGSGLPLVKEYLDLSHGKITIEDNIEAGAVVTISLQEHPATPPAETAAAAAGVEAAAGSAAETPSPAVALPQRTVPLPPLTERERDALQLFAREGALGVTDYVQLTGLPQSSVFELMKKMVEAGLLETTINKKRILTDYGAEIASRLG